MLKKLKRRFLVCPFKKVLKKAKKRKKNRFLLCWNRGLGDIPLGLYAICFEIRSKIEDADITFLVRDDLKDGFLLFNEKFLVSKDFKRGKKYFVRKSLKKIDVDINNFDWILKYMDPTKWVSWQIGKIVPSLHFDKSYDDLYKKFNIDKRKKIVGVHTKSSTTHSPWRDWSKKKWDALFFELEKKGYAIVLFGLSDEKYNNKNIIDLRGKTNLLEIISIIKNCCNFFVAPDGGILSIVYYLENHFDLKIVSLWSDVQGILKQNVDSPNKGLIHKPIFDKTGVCNISVDKVLKELLC